MSIIEIRRAYVDSLEMTSVAHHFSYVAQTMTSPSGFSAIYAPNFWYGMVHVCKSLYGKARRKPIFHTPHFLHSFLHRLSLIGFGRPPPTTTHQRQEGIIKSNQIKSINHPPYSSINTTAKNRGTPFAFVVISNFISVSQVNLIASLRSVPLQQRDALFSPWLWPFLLLICLIDNIILLPNNHHHYHHRTSLWTTTKPTKMSFLNPRIAWRKRSPCFSHKQRMNHLYR